MDEQRILADVKAGKMPSSWQVLCGRRWRALRFSVFAAVVLMFVFLNIFLFFEPFPFFTSWPFLSTMVLVIVFVGVVTLVQPFLESRTHVLVLLPEGVVYGNLKSGQVYRAVTYASISNMKLGGDDVGAVGILIRPFLLWLDEHTQTHRWDIPTYFTMSAMQLVALIFIQHRQSQGPQADRGPDQGQDLVSNAAEVIARARSEQHPPSWRIIQLRRKPSRWNRWLARYMYWPLLGVSSILLLACWVGSWVFLFALLFRKVSVGSSTVSNPLVIAGVLVVWMILFGLLTNGLIYAFYFLPEVWQAFRRIIVVTPDGLVIGDRYTGAVLDAFAWKDVATLDIGHTGIMTMLCFRLVGRKPVRLRFFWITTMKYYTRPTEQIVQAVIEQFAQSKASASIA